MQWILKGNWKKKEYLQEKHQVASVYLFDLYKKYNFFFNFFWIVDFVPQIEFYNKIVVYFVQSCRYGFLVCSYVQCT